MCIYFRKKTSLDSVTEFVGLLHWGEKWHLVSDLNLSHSSFQPGSCYAFLFARLEPSHTGHLLPLSTFKPMIKLPLELFSLKS